jgi:hypothetical protein
MLPQVGYQPITLASPRSSTDSLDIMGEEPMHEPVQKPRTRRWRRLHSTFSFRVKILLGGLAIVLVLLVILIPYFVTTFRKAGGVVDLGYARYQGQKLKGGITQTLGIRYAAPPVGNLRFAAPQDPVTNRKKVQAGNKVIMARFLVPQLVLIDVSMATAAWGQEPVGWSWGPQKIVSSWMSSRPPMSRMTRDCPSFSGFKEEDSMPTRIRIITALV